MRAESVFHTTSAQMADYEHPQIALTKVPYMKKFLKSFARAMLTGIHSTNVIYCSLTPNCCVCCQQTDASGTAPLH
jgi:hypothetical protein